MLWLDSCREAVLDEQKGSDVLFYKFLSKFVADFWYGFYFISVFMPEF